MRAEKILLIILQALQYAAWLAEILRAKGEKAIQTFSGGEKFMNPSVLSEIKKQINQLSHEEQLWLIERLAQNLRESTLKEKAILQNQLADMASDPEIQSELKKIDKEFVFKFGH